MLKEIGYVAERPELQSKLEVLNGDACLSKLDVLAPVVMAIRGKIDLQVIVGLNLRITASKAHNFSGRATLDFATSVMVLMSPTRRRTPRVWEPRKLL